jgi:hypothetical protein
VVRLVKNGPQFKLTIPLDLVKDKGWEAGTEFRFVEDKDGNVTLKPITPAKGAKPNKGKEDTNA